VCVHVLIGECLYVYAYLCLYCVSQKKNMNINGYQASKNASCCLDSDFTL
jgi:hypothetical protein